MVSLDMLIETPGGYDYTGAECAAWMKGSGFSTARVEPRVGPESMVVGSGRTRQHHKEESTHEDHSYRPGRRPRVCLDEPRRCCLARRRHNAERRCRPQRVVDVGLRSGTHALE